MSDNYKKILYVPTDQSYKASFVFDVLKVKAKLPAEPYLLKLLGSKTIYVPGLEKEDIAIVIKKDLIAVGQAPRVQEVENVELLNKRWESFLIGYATGIRGAKDYIADEICLLFGSSEAAFDLSRQR